MQTHDASSIPRGGYDGASCIMLVQMAPHCARRAASRSSRTCSTFEQEHLANTVYGFFGLTDKTCTPGYQSDPLHSLAWNSSHVTAAPHLWTASSLRRMPSAFAHMPAMDSSVGISAMILAAGIGFSVCM